MINHKDEITALEIKNDKYLGFISKNHLDKRVWSVYDEIEKNKTKIKTLKNGIRETDIECSDF